MSPAVLMLLCTPEGLIAQLLSWLQDGTDAAARRRRAQLLGTLDGEEEEEDEAAPAGTDRYAWSCRVGSIGLQLVRLLRPRTCFNS